MPRFRVDIDGEVYEGTYGSMPDAVFGALRKLYIDFNSEWPFPRNREPDAPDHPAQTGKWLIGVEQIPQRGAPRGKAQRVATR